MAFDIVNSLLTILAVAVSGGLFALGKRWLTRRIDRSVDHHYDGKLEEFKSKLQTEGQLKLRQLEQSYSLSGEAFFHGHRTAAEHRIRAITKVWRGGVKLKRSRPRALFYLDLLSIDCYEVMRTDPAHKVAVDEILVDTLESINAELTKDDVDELRPFIGAHCSDLYEIYRGLIYGIPFVLKLDLKIGKPIQRWFEHPTMHKALSRTLDEDEMKMFNEMKAGRISWVLGVLEDKILAELDKILKGDPSIVEGAAQAGRIRSLVEDLMQDVGTGSA